MLVFGVVSLPQAVGVVYSNLNVLGFFLGLMVVAAMAEQAGFFDWLANMAATHSGQSPFRLMLNVMLIGALISAFLTNDATALILTPVVYSLVVRLRLEPLPFMFACTFIADTASFILPVSNPINVLILTSFPQSLGSFLLHLLPAAMAVVTGNITFLLWRFRANLSSPFDIELLSSPRQGGERYLLYTTISLAGLGIAYIVGTALGWQVAIIALAGAVWLLFGRAVSGGLDLRAVAKSVSWSIFGFIVGMLVVVRAVENLGITELFGRALVGISGGSALGAVLTSVFGTAIGANAINNVSAATVMISSIQQSLPRGSLRDIYVYGTILGADLGPNITTVGSLATILWLLILRRRGLDISSADYFKLGITMTPILLFLGAITLWLSTRL